MNYVPAFLLATCLLAGCAHTSKVKVTPVNITPVTHIKAEHFDPDETLELATSLFDEENYLQALEEFSRLRAYNPDDKAATLGAGNSYLALGFYDRAADLFWSDKFDFEDNDWKTGKTLSGIYADKFESDETAIHDAMLDAPNDPRLWNAKGRWHDQKREWQEALSCYVTALNTGEAQSGTINNMGMSLQLQGRYKESLEKFAQAKSLSPTTEVYDNNFRMSHILLGNLRKALDDIEETRASNLLNDAGYVAQQRSQNHLAEQLFEKALEISPVFHVKAQANLDALRAAERQSLLLKAAAGSKASGSAS